MFFQRGAEFRNDPVHFGLGLDGEDFSTKLLDARFGIGWHICKVSNKDHRVDTVKSVEL